MKPKVLPRVKPVPRVSFTLNINDVWLTVKSVWFWLQEKTHWNWKNYLISVYSLFSSSPKKLLKVMADNTDYTGPV